MYCIEILFLHIYVRVQYEHNIIMSYSRPLYHMYTAVV